MPVPLAGWPLAALPLLADAPAPTWTDKEVLYAVGTAIGAVLSALVTLGVAGHRHVTADLRRKNKALAAQVKDLKAGPGEDATGVEAIVTHMQRVQAEAADLVEAAEARGEDKATSYRLAAEKLQQHLGAIQGEVERHKADLAAMERRLRRAVDKDGQIWVERVLSSAPEFKPLDGDRRTPVIATLNLKGGVGKTTATANLGAALAARGYRVLLIDLDLQGSLTGLFLSEAEQLRARDDGRLLEDFLDRAFDAEFPNLLDYAQPVMLGTKSALVATSDTLSYAETNLTIRWLLREANRDPRFLLRKELQLKRVTGRFDVVLLDCPPLLNVSCVNALAASDYVLVPVLPSKQATDRVPILLKRLKQMRENINSELKVMGLLPNRTHRGDRLTNDEAGRLNLLRAQCKDVWGEEVPQLDTIIPQDTEVRRAEDEHRPLAAGDELFGAFDRLAGEVADRLPLFCRPAAAAPAKEAAT